MRILFVNTFYYPNMQGGAEQSVKLLAEGMARRGHEVAVFCVDSRNGQQTIDSINGVKVYRCSTDKFDLYKFSYLKQSISYFKKVEQKVRSYFNMQVERKFSHVLDEFVPDIVHTNTLYGIPFSVWKICNIKGVKIVHTIRDTAIISPVQYGHAENPLIKAIYQVYIRYVSRYVDAVTAPSNYTLSTSLETGAFRFAKLTRCVVNSVPININKLEAFVQERRGRSNDFFKFLYVGRLIRNKGIQQMLEAFSLLNYQRCELRICGAGEYENVVQEAVEKDQRIHYLGKLSGASLMKQYTECDVLIFPSVWPEPFGRVFIEANSFGMPVIAGDCGGIPEIYNITHGGVLCDCRNVANLKATMAKCLSREYLEAMYSNIVDNISYFDIEFQLNEFENIFSVLLKRRTN